MLTKSATALCVLYRSVTVISTTLPSVANITALCVLLESVSVVEINHVVAGVL